MKFVGLQRLRKCLGWKILVLTLLPVFVFIAFDVLDLDGSDVKAVWRHGLFVTGPEQDDSTSHEKDGAPAARPHETAPLSITTDVLDNLCFDATTRVIRQTRFLARRDLSGNIYRADQPTADPA